MLSKEVIRQKILRFLRMTNLLDIENKVMFGVNIIKNFKSNQVFIKEHPDFKFPPYHLAYDAYNHCNYRAYYESGLEQASYFVKTMRKIKNEAELAVCEWGCGPARIIQHVKAIDGGLSRIIGTDYNAESIAWCKNQFSNVEFIKNQLEPPLELADNSIDVLYCFSVFTHLSEEMHYAWINDISRVLKPGGLLICSLHGDNLVKKLLPDEAIEYQKGNIVIRCKVKEGSKNFLAFHPDSFVRNKLLIGFTDIVKPDDSPYVQTIWYASKPQTTSITT